MVLCTFLEPINPAPRGSHSEVVEKLFFNVINYFNKCQKCYSFTLFQMAPPWGLGGQTSLKTFNSTKLNLVKEYSPF